MPLLYEADIITAMNEVPKMAENNLRPKLTTSSASCHINVKRNILHEKLNISQQGFIPNKNITLMLTIAVDVVVAGISFGSDGQWSSASWFIY